MADYSIEQVFMAVEKLEASIEKLDSSVEKINTKLQTFRDELKQEVSAMSNRVIELEVAQRARREQDVRFLDHTWPSHEKYIFGIDTRVQELERDRVQTAKIHELDSRLASQGKELDKKILDVSTDLVGKLIEVEKKADKSTWSWGLFNAGIPTVISIIVAIVAWYIQHGVKG